MNDMINVVKWLARHELRTAASIKIIKMNILKCELYFLLGFTLNIDAECNV